MISIYVTDDNVHLQEIENNGTEKCHSVTHEFSPLHQSLFIT